MVEHLGPLAEGLGILVVRVEHQHMRIRMLVQDRAQQQHHGAGLARAGRPQDAEMLAQQLVGQHMRGQRRVLVDDADLDRGLVRRGVDAGEVGRGRRVDRPVERGRPGGAPAEGEEFAVLGDRGLADQRDLRHLDFALARARVGRRDRQAAHHAVGDAGRGLRLDQGPDLQRGRVVAPLGGVELRRDLRARDGEDAPDDHVGRGHVLATVHEHQCLSIDAHPQAHRRLGRGG